MRKLYFLIIYIFLFIIIIKPSYSQEKINDCLSKISNKYEKGYFVEKIIKNNFPHSIAFNFNIPIDCFVKIELKNLSMDSNIVQGKYYEGNLLNGYYTINCKLDISQYKETDAWIIFFTSFSNSKRLETSYDFIIDLRIYK